MSTTYVVWRVRNHGATALAGFTSWHLAQDYCAYLRRRDPASTYHHEVRREDVSV